MTRQRRSRMHHGIRDQQRKFRTRARTQDIDQIVSGVDTFGTKLPTTQPIDEDLPGMGQCFCKECSKHFISDDALVNHIKSKVHKRRLKEIKEGPYTQKEAELAVGLSTDHGSRSNSLMIIT